ncbi:hypothetical protein J6TS7_65100 [Paenibacillus dendritiformis]|uniref:hypothetical protein n=1 Tax=Paenibacillus TaxID=44249 RepID=UPI001B2B1B0D|nr:hypothetical protein [Paenibacillus dendritiformis]GIO82900.1 hypothetical protein J6TS7_65100 [Paenibacillus dendritiformis]
MNDLGERFERLEEVLRRPLTKLERSKLEQLERPAPQDSGVVDNLLGDMLAAIERIHSQLADVTFMVFVAHDYLQVGQARAAAALDELRKAIDRVQE